METTFYNNSGIYDFYLKSLGHKFENSFPLSFHRHTLNESIFFSQLSNNSIIGFSVEKMSVLIQSSLENFHSKRINEIFVDENVLYSCSNDSSVKIWDLNSNKIIKTFKSFVY